jgi:hypothetical protein
LLKFWSGPPQVRHTPIVEAFVAGMHAGNVCPPIFVSFGRRDDRFMVINGLHRTAASLTLGYSHIPATAAQAAGPAVVSGQK